MFIVWGSKGYRDELGETIIKRTCSHCNNDVRYIGTKFTKKFTVFWIPLFSMETTYFVSCPICGYGNKVSKDDMNEYLLKENNQEI